MKFRKINSNHKYPIIGREYWVAHPLFLQRWNWAKILGSYDTSWLTPANEEPKKAYRIENNDFPESDALFVWLKDIDLNKSRG